MSLIAYVLRNWVHMQLTFAVISTSMAVFYFLVREQLI